MRWAMGVIKGLLEVVNEFKEGFKRGYNKEGQNKQQNFQLSDFRVHIGTYEEGSSIQWAPFEEGSHKIALLGSREKRNKVFMNIERQIRQHPNVPFFKINYPFSRMLGQGTLTNITVFEETTPVIHIPNEILASHRQYFVDLFIRLICDDLKINVNELKYEHYPAQEGSLMGYVRASQQFNVDLQNKFMEHIRSLDNVTWNYEPAFCEFEVNAYGDHNKEFLEFVKGIWSFWVFSMASISEGHRVVCVEVPTRFYGTVLKKT
jgi:hypothetical protein